MTFRQLRLGAPAIVLRHLLPNVVEECVCEVSDDAVHMLLKNNPSHAQPSLILRDVCKVLEGTAYDYVSGKVANFQVQGSDLLIAGYPCEANSSLNPARWVQDLTETGQAAVLIGVHKMVERSNLVLVSRLLKQTLLFGV